MEGRAAQAFVQLFKRTAKKEAFIHTLRMQLSGKQLGQVLVQWSRRSTTELGKKEVLTHPL